MPRRSLASGGLAWRRSSCLSSELLSSEPITRRPCSGLRGRLPCRHRICVRPCVRSISALLLAPNFLPNMIMCSAMLVIQLTNSRTGWPILGPQVDRGFFLSLWMSADGFSAGLLQRVGYLIIACGHGGPPRYCRFGMTSCHGRRSSNRPRLSPSQLMRPFTRALSTPAAAQGAPGRAFCLPLRVLQCTVPAFG